MEAMTKRRIRDQRIRSVRTEPDGTAVRLPRYAYALSASLAVVALASGISTFALRGILHGTAVMNGSARGTALIAVAVAVPCLFVSMWLVARGSARAVFVWLGTTMYLVYNTVMFILGTPLNRLFLVYVVALALGIASAVAVAMTARPADLARHCSPELPARGIAIYLWVVVAANALAWLGRIVPAVIEDDAERLLEGTGLTMIPTYFQDLAFWLPLLAIGAAWLWRRQPWGYLIAGAGLALWALEGLTVAVDQWFGHRADPTSDVASADAVLPFAIATVIGIVALWAFLRRVDGTEPRSETGRSLGRDRSYMST